MHTHITVSLIRTHTELRVSLEPGSAAGLTPPGEAEHHVAPLIPQGEIKRKGAEGCWGWPARGKRDTGAGEITRAEVTRETGRTQERLERGEKWGRGGALTPNQSQCYFYGPCKERR